MDRAMRNILMVISMKVTGCFKYYIISLLIKLRILIREFRVINIDKLL
jgi:hypothetical protein